jgi:hypothetical protein
MIVKSTILFIQNLDACQGPRRKHLLPPISFFLTGHLYLGVLPLVGIRDDAGLYRDRGGFGSIGDFKF